jgi:hypothetical protein
MEQNTYTANFDLPNKTPQEFQKYQGIISDAIEWAQKEKNAPDHVTDEVAADIICVSFLTSDFRWFSDRFINTERKCREVFMNIDRHWRTIAMGVSTPEVEQQYLTVHPDIDREKYFPHLITAPALQGILRRPPLETKPKPTPCKYKTILEFVTNQAPSINYTRTFIFIQKRTKNRFSSRGRKIFPYGQNYVARELNISVRTIRSVFAWLKRQHVIFKRTNENYNRKKCATWFVCTSLKQSTYFLDPKGRRSEKGSPGSPRNRHRRAVHT